MLAKLCPRRRTLPSTILRNFRFFEMSKGRHFQHIVMAEASRCDGVLLLSQATASARTSAR